MMLKTNPGITEEISNGRRDCQRYGYQLKNSFSDFIEKYRNIFDPMRRTVDVTGGFHYFADHVRFNSQSYSWYLGWGFYEFMMPQK